MAVVAYAAAAVEAGAILAVDTAAWLVGDIARIAAEPMASVVTAARTSYPWPLQWGNAFSAAIAYRRWREALPLSEQPGWLTGVFACFVLFAMGGNVIVNILFMNQPPSAFTHATIFPVHVLCYSLVTFSPGDIVYRMLGHRLVLRVLDSMGVIDAFTTGLNYMEVAYARVPQGAVTFPVLCAMSINLGGGILRLFVKHGLSAGLANADDALGTSFAFSLACSLAYYFGALHPCEGESACVRGRGVYELVVVWALLKGFVLEALEALSAGAAKTAKQKTS